MGSARRCPGSSWATLLRRGTGCCRACCQRRLKSDPFAAVENEPFWWLSCSVVGRFRDAAEVVVLEPVAVAFEGDDVGVVDEAVDHGGGDGVVAEDFAPAAELLVAGDDQRCAFVAGADELEEQVRCLVFERDVADLVHRPAAGNGPGGVIRLAAGRWRGVRRAGRPIRRRRTGPGARPGRRGWRCRWRGGSYPCRASRGTRCSACPRRSPRCPGGR